MQPKNTADVVPAESQLYSLRPLLGAAPSGVRTSAQPVALIICHGMGQQVRHETLAEAADNLHRGGQSRGIIPVRYVRFTNADTPGKRERLLPRAEIEVDVPNQPGTRQPVHIYEVYWAPLTEGQIGLTEVVRFLTAAGVRGIRYSFSKFTRWLFGQPVSLAVDDGTFWRLFGVLLLILSLVLINAVMTLVLGENLLQTDSARHASSVLVNGLTWALTRLIVSGIVLAGGLRLCNSSQRKPVIQPFAVKGVWILLFGTGFLLIYSAGDMSWDYFTMHYLAPAASHSLLATPLDWRTVWVVIVWGAAVFISWWCRGFLVQYLGDVAIYVDAYKVDKYFDIRNRIRKLAQHTVEVVYGAKEATNRFQYQRIVITGHSLGSLVAYDALNGLLVADEAVSGGLQIAARTQAFVTSGSPLDKTAFFFHAQPKKTAVYTALDSSRQPLIWDKAVRQKIQWINLYADADIISGHLDYYDSSSCPQQVLNYPDPDAFTPVSAHTQYWNGPKLSRALRFALSGIVPTAAQL